MTTDAILGGVFTVLLAAVTWWVNTIWNLQKETRDRLQTMELNLATNYKTKQEDENSRSELLSRLDRIGNLELLLAQQYVNKVEFKEALEGFTTQLGRIEHKLDNKQDK